MFREFLHIGNHKDITISPMTMKTKTYIGKIQKKN